MNLEELRIRVEETLGQNVIGVKSLLTMVNNCRASIHSKQYREFEEQSYTPTYSEYPATIDLPVDTAGQQIIRKILYVKVKIRGVWSLAQRISLSRAGLKIEGAGVYFYTKGGKLYLDTKDVGNVIEEVVLGYYKKIPKVPMTISQSDLENTELEIREDLEDAFVFYGLAFFANRFKAKVEVWTEYNNTFKYYMEDMLNQLDEEDEYYTDQTIEVYERF